MTDQQVYIQCMTKVRQRIAFIRWLLKDDPLGSNRSMLTTELVFIQFRKILELMAFASLTANKDMYAAEHKRLEYEWSATEVLERLRQVNSNFFPVPLLKQPAQKGPPGVAEPRKYRSATKAGLPSTEGAVVQFIASARRGHSNGPAGIDRSH